VSVSEVGPCAARGVPRRTCYERLILDGSDAVTCHAADVEHHRALLMSVTTSAPTRQNATVRHHRSGSVPSSIVTTVRTMGLLISRSR